jgi:predicted O-methyltransferase YrrM
MTTRIRPCLCALDDLVLRERLAVILQWYQITTVVETGIDWGGSTRFFAQMVPRVIGVDNDPVRIAAFKKEMAEDRLTGIELVEGNSPDVLRSLAASLDAPHTLFFLDAHWQAYWPLKDEIRAIPRGQGILVMHDARVPGVPTLGVDSYDGQELSYEYLAEVLTEWSPVHYVEYNDDTAQGSRRGVMIVYPTNIRVETV